MLNRSSIAFTYLTLVACGAGADDLIVALTGGDFVSIQSALDAAQPGDTILVKEKAGGYREHLHFPRSGDAVNGPIVLRNFTGHQPIVDGRGDDNPFMIEIRNRSYVQVIGLEIRNNFGVNDGSGVRIHGSGSHIEIRDNIIHHMRGFGAMGITVYGTKRRTSISDLIIDGNHIYDCDPADSEALVLNGNVERFEVTNNLIRDVNNIGIDFIGGERDINPTKVTRNGLCSGNTVIRANANYGGGFAAGIYVDGARDIVIKNNFVSGCDLGIEIGAENNGTVTRRITVRQNILVENEKHGLVFGGYKRKAGRVKRCTFYNNVIYHNNALNRRFEEIVVSYASRCKVRNNIIVANDRGRLLYNSFDAPGVRFNFNMWHSSSGANDVELTWAGRSYDSFTKYQNGARTDRRSLFSDPRFKGANASDFSLKPRSPAIDRGDNRVLGTGFDTDFSGNPRRVDDPDHADRGRGGAPMVDIGAHEFQGH